MGDSRTPEHLALAAKALADPRRVKLLRVLLAADTTMCGCELADVLGVPDYQVSRDLATLRRGGLVADRGRSGTWVHYGPARGESDVVDHLLELVTEEVALDAHTERRFDLRVTLREDAGCILGAQHPSVLEAFRDAGVATDREASATDELETL